IIGAESGTHSHACAIVSTGQRGAIAVIHGCGEDAGVLLIAPGRPPPPGFAPLGRRPRRRLFLPPPPEGRPGPAFILFSCVSCIQSARKADANLLSLLAALWMVPCATHNQLARKPQFKWNSRLKIFLR